MTAEGDALVLDSRRTSVFGVTLPSDMNSTEAAFVAIFKADFAKFRLVVRAAIFTK